MKKQIPTTAKSRAMTSYHKHLKPAGKRRANKGTRKVMKCENDTEGWIRVITEASQPLQEDL